MGYPGHRAKIASRLSKGTLFILLSLLGIIAGAPFNIANASANAHLIRRAIGPPSKFTSGSLESVGANKLPDLSFAKDSPVQRGRTHQLKWNGSNFTR